MIWHNYETEKPPKAGNYLVKFYFPRKFTNPQIDMKFFRGKTTWAQDIIVMEWAELPTPITFMPSATYMEEIISKHLDHRPGACYCFTTSTPDLPSDYATIRYNIELSHINTWNDEKEYVWKVTR